MKDLGSEMDNSYAAVMSRKNEILRRGTGIDYQEYEISRMAFDYEGLMASPQYSLMETQKILRETGVGNTPLVELKNLTELVRTVSRSGKGGRIFIKDEAANPSGSFKDRRAGLSIHHAAKLGYKGVVAASSGNYGAAVASQAAKRGLKAIILQEVYDSRKVGQPEILEKTRACEAYGAEVWQLTVGPELFYIMLRVLEDTGFFSASLYVPTSILGIETLGYELAQQALQQEGRFPDTVVITHAGGGNITGTARGLKKAGCHQTVVAGVSVDLRGLHMASDFDFNRKSFTTGHTGFGIPFLTLPDRTDVPRNCARGLRYLDRYVLVSQGEVFYTTELLAKLEGIERGPAGNTSLAGAIALARELDREQILVVQETEYTSAGKLPSSQLTFAKENGIEVKRGNPRESIPGKTIIIPESIGQVEVEDLDIEKIRYSYLENAFKMAKGYSLTEEDIQFLAEDSKSTTASVRKTIKALSSKEQS
ncbi:MAG TPA: 2-amino-4-oxopentanoate thiolase subunit OrtB [Thermodesulfobacteriota bacterium]|nr:2-amino-4-oxopentanoate thiolase subunit OrtB [Thermodesulfobacteriota bacterium]